VANDLELSLAGEWTEGTATEVYEPISPDTDEHAFKGN